MEFPGLLDGLMGCGRDVSVCRTHVALKQGSVNMSPLKISGDMFTGLRQSIERFNKSSEVRQLAPFFVIFRFESALRSMG